MTRSLFLIAIPIMAGVGCGKSSPPAAPPVPVSTRPPPATSVAGPRTENPRYLRWADHEPGTTITIRETTVSKMVTTTTTTNYQLLSVDTDTVVVQSTGQIIAPDGTEYPPNTQEMTYPRWIALPKVSPDPSRPHGTVDEREEPVTVLGRVYPAKWYKSTGSVEAGKTETETWIVDEIPGGLAKSIHRIPVSQKVITSEIVKMTAP